MNRISKSAAVLAVMALVTAACFSGSAETTTTTTTTLPPTTTTSTSTTTTSTTTTTTLPPSPSIASEGDDNSTVAAAQFLLTCLGYGQLEPTGLFDATMTAIVDAAQTALGFAPSGDVTEELFIALDGACLQDRTLEPGEEPLLVFGYIAPGERDVYPISLQFGQRLTVEVLPPTDLVVVVDDEGGLPLEPDEDGAFVIAEGGEYTIEVETEGDGGFYTFQVAVTAGAGVGDWIITTDGISYKGEEFLLGEPAGPIIDRIYEIMGHDTRGSFGEFDTGWDDPDQEGFRGILIEGMAFLFYGPTAAEPGIPETFGRVRYVGPSFDADGNPRPIGWVQTLSGITVGDTLEDLEDTYGAVLQSGQDSVGYYARFPATGIREVCFYFEGNSAPTASTKIKEISTECRGT